MVEDIVAQKAGRGRIEIRSGVGQRRRWSDEEKGRIVAEAVAPGAVVAEIARRHELTPQHLFTWIRSAKSGEIALPAEETPAFVPVVVEPSRTAPAAASRRRSAAIEIAIGAVTVRIPAGVDSRTIEAVLRAVKRVVA